MTSQARHSLIAWRERATAWRDLAQTDLTLTKQALAEDLDRLEQQIKATPGWKVLAPVPLQTLCVRHEPGWLSDEALDLHTQAWAARVNQSGAAYLTPAILDGRWMVRVSIGAEQTERVHVEQLWALMQQAATAKS